MLNTHLGQSVVHKREREIGSFVTNLRFTYCYDHRGLMIVVIRKTQSCDEASNLSCVYGSCDSGNTRKTVLHVCLRKTKINADVSVSSS